LVHNASPPSPHSDQRGPLSRPNADTPRQSSASYAAVFGGPIVLGPDDKPAFADPPAAKEKLKLLWLSWGNKDGLIRISQDVHAHLKEKNVPHVWHVDSNGHDPTHWRNNLYLFTQKVFR
jgi:hypothetical protein